VAPPCPRAALGRVVLAINYAASVYSAVLLALGKVGEPRRQMGG
jgi:hypothetical protein